MNLRRRSVMLACLLCLFCVVSASAGLIDWLLSQTGRPALRDLVEAFGWNWALPILFSVLAALIIAHQPRNQVGWLLMLPALVTAIPLGNQLATPPPALTPALWLWLWFDGWSWIPIIFSIFLIPLHFPTGRPPSTKWNWVNWLAIGMWLFFITFVAFFNEIGPLDYDWTLPNPIGFIPIEVAEGPFLIVWGIGLITVLSTSVASLLGRYRRAQPVERQQIKWLLYVGAIFVVFYTAVYFVSDEDEFGSVGGLANLLFVLSILAFPAAIATAILRHRLFDIDVVIRKTAVYGVLSALLALVYLGSILVLQTIFETVTETRSPVKVVVSTLLIAALFAPLRRRVQGVIDRRFYRRKYDAQQMLARFAQTTRDEVSLEVLTAELVQAVQDTMQPSQVAVWLKSKSDPR